MTNCKLKLHRVLLLLFFLATVVVNGQTFQSRLDSIVHKYDTRGGYNGVIIIAYNPDSIRAFEYGYKDPTAKKEKISLNDRFDLASLAKQFTGIALLQLIDKGLIKPDDNIGKYFPELKPALQKVTIRQLANHTNGIHDFYSLTSAPDTLNNQNILEIMSKPDSTVFVPGTSWGYTNSGYVLAAMLIERVTKKTYKEYCSENILNPLGMTSCTFAPTNKKVLTGYTSKMNPAKNSPFTTGASGLYATGKDMIAYYKAVSKDKDYWNKYFLMSYSLAENSNEINWIYGFGWFFTEDDIGKFRAHSGRNVGFYNYSRWYEQTNTFICLLSNKDDDFIKPLREEVVALVKTELKK